MKTLILSFAMAFTLFACKSPSPTASSSAGTPELESLADSASYAIGLSVSNFYKQQGLKELKPDLVAAAIKHVLNNDSLLLNDVQANKCIMDYMNKVSEENAKSIIDAGEKFLAENKNKPGVITTASGLQYEVIKEGTGPKPKITDVIVAHYKGNLLDGTEVDNSYSRGEPMTIAVTNLVKGWTEALLLMPVGSKWKLYIPYTLGYGTNTNGPIPGGSTLIFELELLAIK